MTFEKLQQVTETLMRMVDDYSRTLSRVSTDHGSYIQLGYAPDYVQALIDARKVAVRDLLKENVLTLLEELFGD